LKIENGKWKNKGIYPFLVIFVSLVFFSGCSLTPSIIKEYDLKIVDKDKILRSIENNYAGIESISGRCKINFYSPAPKRSEGFIYYNQSDSLYIEINGIVGETEAKIFLGPDSFFVDNYFENFYIKDIRENFTLNRVAGVDISMEYILNNSLFGYEEIDTKDIFEILEVDEEQIVLKITDYKNNDLYKLVTLNNNLLFTNVKYFKIDRYVSIGNIESLEFEKKFDYFFDEKQYRLPRFIVFKKKKSKQKLSIFFEGYEVNRFIDLENR